MPSSSRTSRAWASESPGTARPVQVTPIAASSAMVSSVALRTRAAGFRIGEGRRREGDVDRTPVAAGVVDEPPQFVEHHREVLGRLQRRRLGGGRQHPRRRERAPSVGHCGDPAPRQPAVAADPDRRHGPRLRVGRLTDGLEMPARRRCSRRWSRCPGSPRAPRRTARCARRSRRRAPCTRRAGSRSRPARMKRPPDSASTVAAALATRNGLRYGST